MSTETPGGPAGAGGGADAGDPAVPRTRAELRALREAEARAAEESRAVAEAGVAEESRAAEEPRAVEESRAVAEASAAEPVRGSLSEERQRRDETPHDARDIDPASAAPSAFEPVSAAPVREESSLSGGASDEIPPPERASSSRTAEPAEAHEPPPAAATAPDAATPDAAATTPDAATPDAPATTPDAAAATPDAPATTPAATTPDSPVPARPRSRRFTLVLAAVLGILVLVGAGLGAVGLLQGPRLTDAQVDATQAISSSGSRVILTANQALADVDPAQVRVEPEVPFTVDAAGRGVGIRFTVPLDDETRYTVTVAGAQGRGGGPAADLTWSFKTPASSLFLLKRDAEGADKIFRTGLDGTQAVPVFEHERIDDFRATSKRLVVSVAEDDGSHLLVMDADGDNQRELKLPGQGYVGGVQVSERGNLVGYSYSDRELSDTSGRASVLVTQSLRGDDEPQIVKVGDKEASIFAWQFVPDSAAVLFIDFDGALSLLDRSSDSGLQSLGLAANLLGVSRGTYTAIVERLDGTVVDLDLMDGTEKPITASSPDYGPATRITPYPGGTLRHIVARDEAGMPTGQAIIRVGDDGKAEPLVEVGAADSILQACASPSGQYAAIVVAPRVADNPYDEMLLPLPRNLETHLIDLRSGKELVALTGFDASWCQTAPWF